MLRALICLVPLLSACALVPEGSDGKGDITCSGACVCSANESCTITCDDSSTCAVEVETGATASITCGSGSCAVQCDAGATCDVVAGAGATSVECDGAECTETCADSACNMTCDADATCDQDCGASDACTCDGCAE
jgi:hypothetical protein